MTTDGVESVLLDSGAVEASRGSTGRPALFGWTDTGRFIFVVYEVSETDPLVLYPITAYEVEP